MVYARELQLYSIYGNVHCTADLRLRLLTASWHDSMFAVALHAGFTAVGRGSSLLHAVALFGGLQLHQVLVCNSWQCAFADEPLPNDTTLLEFIHFAVASCLCLQLSYAT